MVEFKDLEKSTKSEFKTEIKSEVEKEDFEQNIQHGMEILENLQNEGKNKTFLKKPHKCSFCEVAFSQKTKLKFHIESVHEGKKPHKCSACDAAFSQKGHLIRHIKSV